MTIYQIISVSYEEAILNAAIARNMLAISKRVFAEATYALETGEGTLKKIKTHFDEFKASLKSIT